MAQIPKILDPFTRALAPPFIGRRRDFYIPKTPSSSRNIPNVNTYKNVFSISHIYTPTTSSHSKPGLFGTTTLTLLLAGSWISPFATSELDFRQIPELAILWNSWLRRFDTPGFRMFTTPRLHRFEIPDDRMFATLRLRRFEIIENRMFATLRLRRFEIPENCKCLIPEKHISRTSLNSTFRGWRVFLNSPTLAPRGSGLTPTIRFHEHFGNLVKNITLGTSEGTHVTRKPYNDLIEAGFAELPPLVPINRMIRLLNFFHRSLAFDANCNSSSSRNLVLCSWVRDLPAFFELL
jgi:hypothetical protein